MQDLSNFTDAELDEMSQRSIFDIISGSAPVTPGTPIMVIDAATDRPAVVTVKQLGENLLTQAHSPGYLGTPAGGVLAEQGLGLLRVAGITYDIGRKPR
jgi:hypothetical protein